MVRKRARRTLLDRAADAACRWAEGVRATLLERVAYAAGYVAGWRAARRERN